MKDKFSDHEKLTKFFDQTDGHPKNKMKSWALAFKGILSFFKLRSKPKYLMDCVSWIFWSSKTRDQVHKKEIFNSLLVN